VFFKRKRMLKKEAAGWEGPAAEKRDFKLPPMGDALPAYVDVVAW
jgi:hypothetical protein